MNGNNSIFISALFMNFNFVTKGRKSRLRVTEATLGNFVDVEATYPFSDVCP